MTPYKLVNFYNIQTKYVYDIKLQPKKLINAKQTPLRTINRKHCIKKDNTLRHFHQKYIRTKINI